MKLKKSDMKMTKYVYMVWVIDNYPSKESKLHKKV